MNESTSGGIGFTGLLTVLFIALKLTHVIDWDWWWILAPIWIGAALVIAIILIILAVAVIVEWFDR